MSRGCKSSFTPWVVEPLDVIKDIRLGFRSDLKRTGNRLALDLPTEVATHFGIVSAAIHCGPDCGKALP
jgi:hypothetical protein